MFLYSILCIIASEAVFISAYTIVQIPVNELFMPLVIFVLCFTIFALQICLNKKEIKAKKDNEEIED